MPTSVFQPTTSMDIGESLANNLGIRFLLREQLLPTPNEEIGYQEYLRLTVTDNVGVVGKWTARLFIEPGASKNGGRLWDCVTSWFLTRGLLVAMYRTTKQRTYRPESGERVELGLGNFIPSVKDKEFGHAVRYFRLGCKHSMMMQSTTSTGGILYYCPECSFRLETSGRH